VTLVDALLTPRLSRDAAAPLVTYYDDASGERVELSGATFANWVAKTANLLRDECDLQPGGRVAVLLPAHWQTLAILLGAWWCGASVTNDPAGADVVCCDAARLGLATDAGAGVVVGLSLHAFGIGLPDLPAGVVDYATEVRLHGDVFTPDGPVPDDAVPVDVPAVEDLGVSAVVAAARAAATAAGLDPGARVLTTRDWSVGDGLIEVPLAVLAAGGSLVQCRNVDVAVLERRAASERVTHRL
jgi:uncharacterized protein (TIGR03089 family)